MRREDLFLAIGEVEESRLARSENVSASNVTALEEGNMEMNTKKRGRRPLRLLLVAAVMVAILSSLTLALAGENAPDDLVVVFKPFEPGVFENETELMNAVWGLTGFDHGDEEMVRKEGEVNTTHYLGFDREPLNEEAVEDVLGSVTAVGESISWNGYTLTVDSHIYDPHTCSGVFIFTVENLDGFWEYTVNRDGSFINDWVGFGIDRMSYIVADMTTDTKLTAIGSYINTREPEMPLEIGFTSWAEYGMNYQQWRQMDKAMTDAEYKEWEKSIEECPYSIKLPQKSPGDMPSITVESTMGEVIISPMGARLTNEGYATLLTICFKDGSEYLVRQCGNDDQEEILNCLVENENMSGYDGVYLFNRLIEVEEIASVVIDGDEYFVD